ncbi:MAG: hypothetical protein GY723_22760 [bacterium]|nr:hypothetical protein [bacterium]
MPGVESGLALTEIVWVLVATYAYAAGPILMFGVPILLKTVRLPSRLGLQDVKDEELSERQAQAFQEIDSLMASQGFLSTVTFTAKNFPDRNLVRGYLSNRDPAVALAYAVASLNEHGTLANQNFELETRFSDGTTVQTRNTDHQSVFDKLPEVEIHEHPGIKNPLALKLKHDTYCAPHLAKDARFVNARNFFEHIETDHARQMEYQIERGRWVTTGEDSYRLSVSNAFGQVAAFVNPVKHPRLVNKLVALLALIGLPIATIGLVGMPDAGLAEFVGTQFPTFSRELSVFIAMLPALAIGSVVLGSLFGANTVIWSILVPLAVVRFLLPDGIPGFGGWLPILVMLGGLMQISRIASNTINPRRGST